MVIAAQAVFGGQRDASDGGEIVADDENQLWFPRVKSARVE
jgi:hypothetical protein